MQNPIKNTIIVQIDSENERPIQFSKPSGVPAPTNREEAAKMLLTDITCMAEAITTLIYIAGENKYADKTELINGVIKTLYDALKTSDKTEVKQSPINEH